MSDVLKLLEQGVAFIDFVDHVEDCTQNFEFIASGVDRLKISMLVNYYC